MGEMHTYLVYTNAALAADEALEGEGGWPSPCALLLGGAAIFKTDVHATAAHYCLCLSYAHFMARIALVILYFIIYYPGPDQAHSASIFEWRGRGRSGIKCISNCTQI